MTRYRIITGYNWQYGLPRPSQVVCVDCAVNTIAIDEYYMVHDHLWERAGMATDGGMLCIACLETRLGRDLKRTDFTDAPINQVTDRRSAHLRDRLGLD